MTETAHPARTSSLTDVELLSLYISLPPGRRENIFISTAEAAKITGLSTRTIQLWIECGALRAIVIGRKYRIVLESLREHLRTQMNKRKE
jgi:excisionase family DNA binding protein